MANTYSQMYAHIIFSPKGRQNLILPSFEERIYQYMAGIIKERDQKPIAINGMPDHIHLFIGFKPTMKISELVADVKVGTTKFIKANRFLPGAFSWKDGYGCFTHARSQLDVVAKYVMNQKEHHKTKTFREEYLELLEKFEVSYEEKYLFEFYDELK
jgi:putative transposase